MIDQKVNKKGGKVRNIDQQRSLIDAISECRSELIEDVKGLEENFYPEASPEKMQQFLEEQSPGGFSPEEQANLFSTFIQLKARLRIYEAWANSAFEMVKTLKPLADKKHPGGRPPKRFSTKDIQAVREMYEAYLQSYGEEPNVLKVQKIWQEYKTGSCESDEHGSYDISWSIAKKLKQMTLELIPKDRLALLRTQGVVAQAKRSLRRNN